MNNDILLKQLNAFIDTINRNQKISVQGLRNMDFPDKNIARLHNKLGNAKHYISNENASFNGTDQILSLKYAQQAIKNVADELFILYQRGVLNLQEYNSLNDSVHQLDIALNNAVSPEY